jgi:hypothetical protein
MDNFAQGALLRVNEDPTAQRYLTRVQEALGVQIHVEDVERYW